MRKVGRYIVCTVEFCFYKCSRREASDEHGGDTYSALDCDRFFTRCVDSGEARNEEGW